MANILLSSANNSWTACNNFNLTRRFICKQRLYKIDIEANVFFVAAQLPSERFDLRGQYH
jgi:hypothetical protein